MNKKILSLILTCLIIIPSSGLAAMPQFADRGEKSENKQQRRFAPAKQDDREDDREDDRQEKLREKLELRLLRDLEDALEDHDLENNNDDDNLDDDQMDALEDHQDQEHEEILNKKLRIKDLIKEKDREFFMQKPKKIQKIIKDDLKEFKQQNSKKYELELESDDANIEIKIESPEHAVRILNLRNLSSSDSISGRIGETIEITSQDPKKIQLIFEVPSDQNNFILTINQEIYTINNLETKELSLDSNTIKEIELKLLTEKKLLKETRDYEFSNKENEIGERLAKINEKIANKQQCLELEDKLENMEFDGFENQA